MSDCVYLTDVAPRDGLQNQPGLLALDERKQLIAAIAAAGIRRVEAGSFVSPKVVPCMAGTDQLFAALPRADGVEYSALIPNMKGYELALQAGAEPGAAAPSDVRDLTRSLVQAHNAERLACHFHDTRAMGLANVYAALEAGIRQFDTSIAGLGGCPFAPGAGGNIATEDVVMMLEQMGFNTGVDLALLLQAAELAEQLTGSAPGGRASNYLKPKYNKHREK